MTSKYSRVAVLLLSVVLFVSFVPVSVLGEEGMFLPDTLNQLPLAKLKQRGLKIPITDIYNPNGPSIKDAVVTVAFEVMARASSYRLKASSSLIITSLSMAWWRRPILQRTTALTDILRIIVLKNCLSEVTASR